MEGVVIIVHPWGLHEYLVTTHSLSRARNDIV